MRIHTFSAMRTALPFMLAICLAASLIPGCSVPSPEPAEGWGAGESEALEKFIVKEMKDNGIVGLSIAVISGGRTAVVRGFGNADAGKKIPVTGETPMPVASVTKLFTATAIMKLVESGGVALDAPVSRYLPEFSLRYRGGSEPGDSSPGERRLVTVRDLLRHTGGIPSDFLAGYRPGSEPEPDFTREFERVAGRLAGEYAAANPGELYVYSNAGYELLGTVVSRVSGCAYGEYVERNILRPLRMTSSFVADSDSIPVSVSRGFHANGREAEFPFMRDLPAGALASSALDLCAFMKLFLSGGESDESRPPVLGGGTIRRMLEERGDECDESGFSDPCFPAGLGFHHMTLESLGGVHVAYHDGGTYPFSSTLMLLPESGIGVAVLVNTGEHPADRIALEAVRLGLKSSGIDAAASRSSVRNTVRHIETEGLAGVYATEMGVLRIRKSGGRMLLDLGGISFLLKRRDDGSFGVLPLVLGLFPVGADDTAGISLVPVGIGPESVLAYYEGNKFRGLASKIIPVPVPPVWLERLGYYRTLGDGSQPFLEETHLSYDEKSGFLMLTVRVRAIPEPLSFAVEPLSDTELRIMGKGRHMGDVLTAERKGGTVRLRYSGLELERRD